jgi:hypothetical protein
MDYSDGARLAPRLRVCLLEKQVKNRSRSRGAALAVVGIVAVGAAGSGCSAAPDEQTGNSSQGLVYRPPISYPIRHPSLPITDFTSPPVDDGGTCGSTAVAIPTALAGAGCSLGVEIEYDPSLQVLPSVLDLTTGDTVQAYAWACPSSVDVEALSADLSLSGDGYPQGTFGGPSFSADVAFPQGVSAVSLSPAWVTDSCYGMPDAGYQIVLEYFRGYHSNRPTGCHGGGCEPIPVGGGGSGTL